MAVDAKMNVIIDLKGNIAKGLDKVEKKFGSMKDSLDKMNKAANVAMLGLVTGFGLVLREAGQFEKAMSKVEAITNSTAAEMANLTKLAKEMGKTTVFTAKEAAEGMKFLGMAGFTTNEIMESLPATLNLAAAGAVELGVAADISSNILKGFRLEANQMNRIVDVMAATVTSSNTDIMELGEAMKFLAPTAAALGISIEEASAAVGLLANAGLKGSMATSVLQTSMQKLSDPTEKMMEGMNAAGLAVFNAEGNFVGLKGILEQLEIGMEGFTQQQRVATLSQIFGVRAAKQFNILLVEGSEKLGAYTKELEEAGGAAQRMADVQLDNLAGKMDLLKSAVSGVAIEFGETLLPMATEAIQKITELTVSMKKAFDDNTLASNILIGSLTLLVGWIVATKVAILSKGLVMAMRTLAIVTGATTAEMGLLRGAIAAIPLTLTIAVALIGFALVMQQIRELKSEIGEAAESASRSSELDQQAIQRAREFRAEGDIERAQRLEDVVRRNLQTPNLQLADGGIVTRPTRALIGEAGPEAVIPLTKMNKMGTTINFNIQGDVVGEEAMDKMFDGAVRNLQLNSAIVG